ncbi:hypothetical protein SKAU_G00256000 [Synaphobranchus kaupii]|uniref:Uncharacterized protein n=1 Tax=Synaphobranchus kaupii TaxID=118154 RepID=A0A9Q1F432_SYNKA|nr:hypothetical protein SKAU_G00256000 [Synaphobranchus kaupii]
MQACKYSTGAPFIFLTAAHQDAQPKNPSAFYRRRDLGRREHFGKQMRGQREEGGMERGRERERHKLVASKKVTGYLDNITWGRLFRGALNVNVAVTPFLTKYIKHDETATALTMVLKGKKAAI